MRISVCKKLALMCLLWINVGTAEDQPDIHGALDDDSGICGFCSTAGSTPESPFVNPGKGCNDFFEAMCPRAELKGEESEEYDDALEAPLSAPKKSLLEKIQDVLDDASEGKSSSADEDGHFEEANIESLARGFYSVCQKGDLVSKKTIKASTLEMLKSFGIDIWPVTDYSGTSYQTLFVKTGLRPVATLTVVPDRKMPIYTLALNALYHPFAPYPEVLKEKARYAEAYERYISFVQSVVRFFKSCAQDEESISTTYNGYLRKDVHDANEEEVGQVAADIVEVEEHLAHMSIAARTVDAFETDNIQSWETRLGKRFPLMDVIRNDFNRINRDFANNYELGIHLPSYFKNLFAYLETLELRKLVNYLGWYEVRQVADVLTRDVRVHLNSFLRSTPKPGIPVDLSPNNCIEKLIGHNGMMRDGIAYLYLQKYWSQANQKKAMKTAEDVKRSLEDFIENNSWMDEGAREKMKIWIKKIRLHVGAPENLFDVVYMQQQYDRVKIPQYASLPVYISALRENAYLQKLKLYRAPYHGDEIWPVSALETTATYVQPYGSIEIPAGVLQYPMFSADATVSALYGTIGTLAGEMLAQGFTEEGDLWGYKTNTPQWTREIRKTFKDLQRCLKKATPQGSKRETKRNPRKKFHNASDKPTLALKFRDYMGLRISFKAFSALVSKCKPICSNFNPELQNNLLTEFFAAFASRHCMTDDTLAQHRVNFALSSFPDFALTFGCKSDDNMNGEDTCRILN